MVSESYRMRQVARCNKGKLTEEGQKGPKRGHHKGSDSYQESAKHQQRVRKGKESSGPQNNTKKEENVRNRRARKREERVSAHKRRPGECGRESSAPHLAGTQSLGLSHAIRGAVRSEPVRWGTVKEDQTVGL